MDEMNDNSFSKKRKKSFANDRLKRLRTSINSDSTSSQSPDIPKLTVTQSVKSSIPNNPQGFQERKRLKPVRKLKTNDNERYLEIANKPKQNDTSIVNEQSDESDSYAPKRRKIDVPKSLSEPSSGKNSFSASLKDFNGNASLVHKTSKKWTQDQEKLVSSKCSSTPNRNDISLTTNKASVAPPDTTRPTTSRDNNESSVSSRLASIKSGTSKFSEICSSKTKFEYQYNKQTPDTNKNSGSNGEHGLQMNTKQYFGEALNSVYNKLFGTQQDSKNKGQEANENADLMDWEPDDGFPSNVPEKGIEKSSREMYIIVDTNIFLDSLSFLEGIIKYGSNDGIKPVIYVPWMVFNELDFIKDNRSSGLKSVASKAIDFINKMLTQKDGKLIGQSIFEANNQMYVGKSPDDKITSCCLQVKAKGLNAMLLSNDKNLRNKLIINGIPSFSCSDFLKNFDEKSPHKDNLNVLLDEMSKCCTCIITDCCEEAYGAVWNKLALLDKQPWSFKICLEIFKKYWFAVFREKFLKQFLKTVEKMISVLNNSGSLKNPGSFESFANDCLSLCFFMTDLEQHKGLIQATTKKINSMVSQKS
ncbi:uncharacterized protein LOC123320486 [Coccinella septempunctata]|uniref:uncharacterized protein LOC123320486 n=1 Tax=Coccinella septempunctata TaxID=41139 RepID=UPI001D07E0D7|nr:uncharacterized protein LOC123320486 [Coccinella septempunctata]